MHKLFTYENYLKLTISLKEAEIEKTVIRRNYIKFVYNKHEMLNLKEIKVQHVFRAVIKQIITVRWLVFPAFETGPAISIYIISFMGSDVNCISSF